MRPVPANTGRGQGVGRVVRWIVTCLVSAATVGCRDDAPVAPPVAKAVPVADILDGASAGNPHFFFLPPLVPKPTYSGVSDAAAPLTVVVCDWLEPGSLSAHCGDIIAQFSRAAGTGSEVVRYDNAGQFYIVNWNTDQCLSGACVLDPAKTYRLRVLVGAAEVGHADVKVARNGSELKNVATNDIIGLVNGRTLPVKFRIEKGAVAMVDAGTPAQIGAAGGRVASTDGQVALAFPAGALTETKPITIDAAPAGVPPTGEWAVPVSLGPDGTTFATPVALTLGIDASKLPPGVGPSGVVMLTYVDGGWREVPGSVVNAADATVSAPISHFSYYTVGLMANTVNGVPSSTQTILVGDTATATAWAWYYWTFQNGYCWTERVWHSTFLGGYYTYEERCYSYLDTWGYPLTGYQIAFASSAPNILSPALVYGTTDANGIVTSPPFTAVTPGVSRLTAYGPGVTASVEYRVLDRLRFTPRSQAIVAGWTYPQAITTTVPAATDISIALLNRNQFLMVAEPGTANYTAGGETRTYTLASGSAQKTLSIFGVNGLGVDTLVATAPGYGPDTAIITTIQGRLQLSGLPTSLTLGDSAAVQLTAIDDTGNPGALAYAASFDLAGSGVSFGNGSASITAITIPQRTSQTFYVKAVTVGTATLTVSHPWYHTLTLSVPVTTLGPVTLTPRRGQIPFGFTNGFTVSVPTALATPATISVTNRNTAMHIAEPGTSNRTFGGQTGSYVLPAGATSKLLYVLGDQAPGLTDTIIVSIPGFTSDTAILTSAKPTFQINGLPSTMAVGDSAQVTISVLDQDGGFGGLSGTITIALAGARLTASNGIAPITGIQARSIASDPFYIKATAAGTGTLTLTHPWFQPRTVSIPVTPATTQWFADRTQWEATAPTPRTDVTFTTRDGGTPITNPSADVGFESLDLRGATFLNAHTYYNQLLYQNPGVPLRVNLPAGTRGVAADLGVFYPVAGTYTVRLSNGAVLTQASSTRPSGDFVGVVTTEPITWIEFSHDNTFLILSKLTYAGPPSPPSWYVDRSAWVTAAPDGRLDVTFTARDDGSPITNPSADTFFESLTLRGVTFLGVQSYHNQFLYTYPNSALRVNLPTGTRGVAADLGIFYPIAGMYTIRLSSGAVFTRPSALEATPDFVGVITTEPITWIEFSYDNTYLTLSKLLLGKPAVVP